MMSITRGLANMITDGQQIIGFPAWFNTMVIVRFGGFLTLTVARDAGRVRRSRLLYQRYRHGGRILYAIGGNAEVARLAGINVKRATVLVYVVCSFLAGLAGMVLAARLDSVQPSSGVAYELDAIAAVVIGGTSLSGGTGGDRRHHHRRPHHRRAAQRPQPAQRVTVHAAGDHRRRHRAGRHGRDLHASASENSAGQRSAAGHGNTVSNGADRQREVAAGKAAPPAQRRRNHETVQTLLCGGRGLPLLMSPLGLCRRSQEDRPCRSNLQADFFNQIKLGVEKYAKDKGIEVIVVDAKNDTATQVSQVQDLMTQGIDAFIYIPAGAAAAAVPTRLARGSRHSGDQRRPRRRRRARRHLHRRRKRRLRLCGLQAHHRKGRRLGQDGHHPRPEGHHARSRSLRRAASAPSTRTRASSWSTSSGATCGRRTRASRSRRTCCRRIPTSRSSSGRPTVSRMGAAKAVDVANLSDKVIIGGYDGDVSALEYLASATGPSSRPRRRARRRWACLPSNSAIKVAAGEKVPETPDRRTPC